VVLAERGREVLADLVEFVLQVLGGELTALLDQIEGGSEATFQVLAVAELQDDRRDGEAVTLDRRAGELQLDVLQIGLRQL